MDHNSIPTYYPDNIEVLLLNRDNATVLQSFSSNEHAVEISQEALKLTFQIFSPSVEVLKGYLDVPLKMSVRLPVYRGKERITSFDIDGEWMTLEEYTLFAGAKGVPSVSFSFKRGLSQWLPNA